MMTYTHIPPIGILEQVAAAQALGTGCEINLDARVIDMVNVDSVTPMLRGVTVHSHGPFMDLNPGSLDRSVRELTRERVLQALLISHYLSSELVVFHSGYSPQCYSGIEGMWLENATSFWLDILKNDLWHNIGADESFIICIENHFEQDVGLLRELIERVGSPRLRCCFDLSHSYLYSNGSIMGDMDILAPFISEIHVNDTDGLTDTHQTVGSGVLDIRGVILRATTTLNNPSLTIEVLNEQSAQDSVIYLKGLLG